MSNRPWICPVCGEPSNKAHCPKCFAPRPFNVAPYNAAGSYMSTAYGPGSFIDGEERPGRKVSMLVVLLIVAILWFVASITHSIIVRLLDKPTLIETPAGPTLPTAP